MRGVCDASGAAIVHITNATTIRIETSPLKSCMPQMRPGGFEPPTNSLEGCCSIHLSYGRLLLRIADCELRILGVWIKESHVPKSAMRESGRRDSNPRPPGPKPGALPDCATPRNARQRQNKT